MIQPQNDLPTDKGIESALTDASRDVVKRAKETGTHVIVWRRGQIVRLTADEAEQELNQQSIDNDQSNP